MSVTVVAGMVEENLGAEQGGVEVERSEERRVGKECRL